MSPIDCPTQHSHTEIETLTSCVISLVQYIILPSLGLSDHDIVQVLVNTIPRQTKRVPHNIPLYKKADLNQFKQSMKDFQSLTLLPQMSKNCGIGLLADPSKVLINLFLQGKLAPVMVFHG